MIRLMTCLITLVIAHAAALADPPSPKRLTGCWEETDDVDLQLREVLIVLPNGKFLIDHTATCKDEGATQSTPLYAVGDVQLQGDTLSLVTTHEVQATTTTCKIRRDILEGESPFIRTLGDPKTRSLTRTYTIETIANDDGEVMIYVGERRVTLSTDTCPKTATELLTTRVPHGKSFVTASIAAHFGCKINPAANKDTAANTPIVVCPM